MDKGNGTGKTYTVRETFLTLQGEGTRAGKRSVFLRFSGCNMWSGLVRHRGIGKGACAQWCDTDFNGGTKYTAAGIVKKLDSLWPRAISHERWVVMTGGEPLLQLDAELIDVLTRAGWSIALETNGTIALPSTLSAIDGQRVPCKLAHVCVSPKLQADGSFPELAIDHADELKVVLPGHIETGRGWTDEKLRKLELQVRARHHFVQPQDPLIDPTLLSATYLTGKASARKIDYQRNVARCVEFVMANPMWTLGTQAHKHWELP